MLVRPQIKVNYIGALSPIDSTKDNLIEFDVNGGDQVVGNRITIYIEGTNKIAFQETINNFEFNHIIPKNALTNGQKYTIVIQTKNIDNQLSEISDMVSLKCYSEIVLTINNITDGKIKNQNEIFKATYSQAEGATLNSYMWKFYDSSKNLLYSSGELFDDKLEYSTTGWNNNENYYVELITITTDYYEKSTGLIPFTAQYLQPILNNVIAAENNKDKARIEINAHVIQIMGHMEDGKIPTYINDEEIDLSDGSKILYSDLLILENHNWTLQIWLRDLDENEHFMSVNFDNFILKFIYRSNKIIVNKIVDNIVVSHYGSNELDSILKTDNIVLNVQSVNDRLNITIIKNN